MDLSVFKYSSKLIRINGVDVLVGVITWSNMK